MYIIDLYVTQAMNKAGELLNFNRFHTYDKKGKRLTVKFTRDCDPPHENCRIHVINGNVNRTTKFPVLWINNFDFVETIKEDKDNLKDFFEAIEEKPE